MGQTVRRGAKIEDTEACNLDEDSGRPFLRKLQGGVGDAAGGTDRTCCPGRVPDCRQALGNTGGPCAGK